MAHPDASAGPGATAVGASAGPGATAVGASAVSGPAAVIPDVDLAFAGLGGQGLPIGHQSLGREGDEATVLAQATGLEDAGRWTERRPPTAVGA